MSVNVAEYLLAAKASDRIACQFLRETLTYGDLNDGSAAVARYLFELGCEPGDRVCLIDENSPFWVISYLGILRAGLICVPLPAAADEQNLQHILGATRARAAFARDAVCAKHSSLFKGLHVVTSGESTAVEGALSQRSFSGLLSGGNKAGPIQARNSNELAALMFTSGSTGLPRGVMISHGNIIANTESILTYLKLTPEDRMMAILPFHYCFGTSLLHTHLRVGGSLVVDQRFMYAETVLQRMAETECTGFAGVPSHFQLLLRNSSIRKKPFPHLRQIQQAGGHLAPNFVSELRDAFPGSKVFLMYGQTEATARLSYLPPEYLDSKAGSIGKGVPGVRLSVEKDSGKPVSPGETGEIIAEGENIGLGYWCEPAESEAVFRGGRLHTGDLATVDSDGFIFVVDRARDFLKCGGVRVSCRLIEEKLLCFEELLEAAVVGAPDDVLGESVKAFVVPVSRNNTDFERKLGLFCREHLDALLFPRQIVVLSALPKNSAGKVLKQQLRNFEALRK